MRRKKIAATILVVIILAGISSCVPANNDNAKNDNARECPEINAFIEDETLSIRPDGADLVYTIKHTSPLSSIRLQELRDGDWKDQHVITVGGTEEQTFRICNFVNGQQPYFKGAEGFVFKYCIGNEDIKTISIPLTLTDTKIITVFSRSFSSLELQNDDVLLGYFIITNKRGNYSSWGPEAYETKSGITDNMQVIAVILSQ